MDQVALEGAGRLVGHLGLRESPDGSPSPPRFAIRLRRFASSKCIVPAPLPVHLDDEHAECLGLTLRSVRPRPRSRLRLLRAHRRQERLDVLVCEDPTRKSTSSSARAPDRDAHAGSSCAPARERRNCSPEARATPAEDQHEADERGHGDGLVEEHRAVEHSETGDQVRDERKPPRAEQAEHPEQDQLGERRSEDRSAPGATRPPRRPAHGRELEERKRQEDEHRRRASSPSRAQARDRLAPCAVRRRRHRICERGDDDRERSRDGPPAASRVETRQHGHADEPERDADDTGPCRPLVRQEARRERGT